jgi:VanZ family protein
MKLPSRYEAARVTGCFWMLGLGILSLLPSEFRPHLVTSGFFEHFGAYFGAGTMLAVGYATRSTAWAIALLLILCAGLLEIAQLLISFRTARFTDFAAGSLGALAGVGIIVLGTLLYERLCNGSQASNGPEEALPASGAEPS